MHFIEKTAKNFFKFFCFFRFIHSKKKKSACPRQKFSSSNGWLYSSGGHFMSVYGAKSDKSEFALADPWIGYSNSGLAGNGWSYSKSATDIFKAYNSVNIGLMY